MSKIEELERRIGYLERSQIYINKLRLVFGLVMILTAILSFNFLGSSYTTFPPPTQFLLHAGALSVILTEVLVFGIGVVLSILAFVGYWYL